MSESNQPKKENTNKKPYKPKPKNNNNRSSNENNNNKNKKSEGNPTTSTSSPTTSSPPPTEVDELEYKTCLICASPMDGKNELPTVVPCGHNDVCSICFLRLRFLQQKFECPSCKQDCENVICSISEKKYEDYQIWGGNRIMNEKFYFEPKSRMFFPPDYFKDNVSKLISYSCKKCKVIEKDYKKLMEHYELKHNRKMCNLCVEHKQCFPYEQQDFTPKDYDKHIKIGGTDGFKGHPYCEFCDIRFYDDTAIFTHLIRDHFECSICTKENIKLKYYNKYENLENHYRREHFICEDPICLEKKFIVFSSEIELASHNAVHHPHLSRAINLHFSYKNDNLCRPVSSSSKSKTKKNKEYAFEGGLGGIENDGEWKVIIQPVEGSGDPRDENRNISSSSTSSASSSAVTSPTFTSLAEEFPTLPSSGTGAGTFVYNASYNRTTPSTFTAVSSTKSKTEEFPELPSAPTPVFGVKKVTNKLQKNQNSKSINDLFASSITKSPKEETLAGAISSWGNISSKKLNKKKPSSTPMNEDASQDEAIARALEASINLGSSNQPPAPPSASADFPTLPPSAPVTLPKKASAPKNTAPKGSKADWVSEISNIAPKNKVQPKKLTVVSNNGIIKLQFNKSTTKTSQGWGSSTSSSSKSNLNDSDFPSLG